MFKVNQALIDKGQVMAFENLSYTINSKSILNNVSHQLNKGCFYSIVGCNGSGKTTLLKSILQIIKPSGQIYIPHPTENKAHYMSYVPQNTQLEFDFTVEEVVMMGRYPYYSGITGPSHSDKQKVKDALKLTDMLHFAGRSVKTLSGGEKQRTIIARALAQDTPVMLLDEPVSQLDIYHQIEVLKLLRQIVNQQNKTIVTVLHDLNQVVEFTDEVMVMNNGFFVAHGKPIQILNTKLLRDIFKINADWVQSSNMKPHLAYHY